MREFGNYVVLEGQGAAIVEEMQANATSSMIKDAEGDAKRTVSPKGKKTSIDFYPWGADNDLPNQLIKNSYKNNVLASNLEFNAHMGYGDGIQVVRKERNAKGDIVSKPLLRADAPEIFDFLRDNNINLLLQELIHDNTLLHNGFIELIMSRKDDKVTRILHKEAAYSRISVMDEKTSKSEYHGYSSEWEKLSTEDVIVTPLLDFDNPLYDYMIRTGKAPGLDGRLNAKGKSLRYVMHLAMPSPGKFYYQKAYWWSIFESHWFDFSCAIPEFKMNLMKNQMVLKYHVKINKTFFPALFTSEKITDLEKQKTRRTQFYNHLENFLGGKENAGKNIVTEFDYHIQTAIERQDIIITPIENFIKGGEYIEDSEEASNAICYAMGVHPSLKGASPGKSKTINGTEARELFIIKQSMMKPFRDILLQPLKLVQYINGWDEDIDFVIPNIMLTTLDKNTGAEKQIGNQKL